MTGDSDGSSRSAKSGKRDQRLMGILILIALAVYLEGYCLYRMQNKLDQLVGDWEATDALPRIEEPPRSLIHDEPSEFLEIEGETGRVYRNEL